MARLYFTDPDLNKAYGPFASQWEAEQYMGEIGLAASEAKTYTEAPAVVHAPSDDFREMIAQLIADGYGPALERTSSELRAIELQHWAAYWARQVREGLHALAMHADDWAYLQDRTQQVIADQTVASHYAAKARAILCD